MTEQQLGWQAVWAALADRLLELQRHRDEREAWKEDVSFVYDGDDQARVA